MYAEITTTIDPTLGLSAGPLAANPYKSEKVKNGELCLNQPQKQSKKQNV